MGYIGEIVEYNGSLHVVSEQRGKHRTLIGPVVPVSAYIDVLQQTEKKPTRDNPSGGGWETTDAVDYIDITPEDAKLLADARTALEAAKDQKR